MSKMGEFIAFQAVAALLKERRKEGCLQEIYDHCKELHRNNQLHTENVVKRIYKLFTIDEITNKIAELVTPKDLGYSCPGYLPNN